MEISNSDDVIDSRDVIARIAELESEQADALADGTIDEWERQGYGDELEALRDLAAEGEQCCEDWTYGETLVRDSYFRDYAEQLAEDIGAIDRDAGWPKSFIDWDAAADALKVDYSELTFDGVTYWAR